LCLALSASGIPRTKYVTSNMTFVQRTSYSRILAVQLALCSSWECKLCVDLPMKQPDVFTEGPPLPPKRVYRYTGLVPLAI
jgi:hypothetical protein